MVFSEQKLSRNDPLNRGSFQNPSPRVGLALGGGVARGLAHIGVLEVLIRENIPIHYVAGTSAGAIIGAAYCAGIGIEKLKELGLGMKWQKLVSPTLPLSGALKFDRMEKWLISQAGDLRFDDLKIPLAVEAIDIENDCLVTLNKGRLAPAIHASSTVPGFAAPVRIDGRLLADGTLLNSVPVSTARAMGADYVIGVDILTPKLRRSLGVIGYGLNALEMMARHAGRGVDEADCIISPALAGKSYLRFSKGQELIELGQKAAEAKIPAIKADINL